MKVYLKYASMVGVMAAVACSPVKFAQTPAAVAAECNGLGASACVVNPDSQSTTYDVAQQVGKGVADILIIDDNSGSMSFEQKAMASHFSGFISSLQNVDYRIAITTTDVSGVSPAPSGANSFLTSPYPAARDGNLLSFASGPYLTPSVGLSEGETEFGNTVQRQETIDCEDSYNFSPSKCPSDDERAIYAANLVAKNNPSGFIRPSGELTVIILSDEDARSGNYRSSSAQARALFPLASMDQPSTLIANIKAMYPNKTLSVHSIVVEDTNCQTYQMNEIPGNTNISSSIGQSYLSLSNATGGSVGSICGNNNDLNYTAQLGQISGGILNQPLTLGCTPNAAPQVYICSSVAAGNKCQTVANSSDYSYNSSTNVVTFSSSLGVGTTERVVYTCNN